VLAISVPLQLYFEWHKCALEGKKDVQEGNLLGTSATIRAKAGKKCGFM
jgi:hypothetical protein